MIDLKLGDCLEVMKSIPDKSIDMILCDLPYGTTACRWDVVIPFEPLWEQYERVIKNNGAIVLFGQGLFFIDLVCSNRKLFKYDLVWNKQLTSGFLNANRMPLRQHEQVAIFYKKPPTYNPQFSLGNPLHSKGTAYKTKKGKNNNYSEYKQIGDERKGFISKYPTSILLIQKPHPSNSIHPTQKPVELCEYLIKTYTNEGETVLDNCIGSGTTGVACKNLNRNFIGIEKEETYFNMAKERIENS